MLQAEEEKAWKKIEHTKERAEELVKLREQNDRKALEKRRQREKLNNQVRAVNRKPKEPKVHSAANRKDVELQMMQKREEVQTLKLKKQQWRKEVEASRRKNLAKAVRKKESILKHEEQLKSMKAKKQAELELFAKRRAEERIREEEELVKTKQLEVKEMEKMELALIQRLQSTQKLQKKAFDELEKALCPSGNV